MSAESIIKTALSNSVAITNIVGQRFYSSFPENSAVPFIVFIRGASQDYKHLGGVSNLEKGIVHVFAVADYQDQAVNLSDTIKQVLHGYHTPPCQGMFRDNSQTDTPSQLEPLLPHITSTYNIYYNLQVPVGKTSQVIFDTEEL